MSDTLKKCRAGRTHDDALQLVEYIMARGGKVQKSNEAIADDLGMRKNRGGGVRLVDMPRFAQARRHVQDGTSPDGKPCTGYRLHYRSTARDTEFALADSTGDMGSHVVVAIESVRGWLVRERQHQTENHRQIEIWERLGDHALARNDKTGYRICMRAAIELEQDGTVSSKTMADANVWLDALRAAA